MKTDSGADREQARTRGAAIALALTLTAVSLTLGYLLKRQCVHAHEGDQYRKNCYSDILFLYGNRDQTFNPPGKDKPFSAGGLAYRDNNLEYPALTGLFISTANVFVASNAPGEFLSRNAILLSVITLIGAGCLMAVSSRRWRIVMFSFSPALVSYAFHNWDLLPAGFMAIAIWAYTRERDQLAGAMLGLGAAAKVFPGLLIPAFFLARRREQKPAGKMLAQFAVWFVIPNAIVLAYAGSSGWWFPWKFQSERFPNFETFAFFVYHHGSAWFHSLGNDFWFGTNGGPSPYARIFQVSSLAVFGVSALILLWREWRRPGAFRPFATGMGILILFLLTAKVFSPQYAIWLLPLFVVVGVPVWTYVVFAVTDLLVLGLIWSYFTHYSDAAAMHRVVSPLHLGLLEIGVYARYAALGLVLWKSRSAPELLDTNEELPSGAASDLWETAPAPNT